MLRKDVTKGSPTTVGTTDRTEIAGFDALAEEWWKPDGAFKVVHAFNWVRGSHCGALARVASAGPARGTPLRALP
jgi:2-polyprenyl-6-hydroxyphenyl methylase/3-demethylubiquinone-9 3-methyltransferase